MKVYEYKIDCNYDIQMKKIKIFKTIVDEDFAGEHCVAFISECGCGILLECFNCIKEVYYYYGQSFYSLKKLSRKDLKNLKNKFVKHVDIRFQ